ncbi:MAG: SidA/IucD/PvdA family monooxygenase [Rhodobacter sp.]|nr:SidA/IucD/PvdA family monooxygenase [Rhodobacter sp.]
MNQLSRLSTALVGAGPANLAVLACMQDLCPDLVARTQLIERRSNSDWHPDFRFDSSTLQVSLLKDLAFTRDPTSKFTFWSFMHQQNLLNQFIHLNTYYPSRSLFSRYLNWVQDHFDQITRFDTEVTEIQPAKDGYRIRLAEGEDRRESEILTRNVVIALGHEPHMPSHLKCGDDTFHAIKFQSEFERHRHRKDLRVAVVGAGQTAGELIQNLMRMENVSDILSLSRGFLFRQTDDNPFVNDLYTFNGMRKMRDDAPIRRRALMAELSNSNYAAVTSDILQDIYRLNFEDSLNDRQRLRLQSHSEVLEVSKVSEGLRLVIRDGLGNRQVETVDLLVACTGFRNSRHLDLLAPLDLRLNDDGQIAVNQNYRVEGTGPQSGIFLVNHATDTALAEHTLGGLAGRAELICKDLFDIDASWKPQSTTQGQLATAAV